MEIRVFKTNIKHLDQIIPIRSKLNLLGTWNFDLEDCDKIFRIETKVSKGKIIEQIFNQIRVECQELH